MHSAESIFYYKEKAKAKHFSVHPLKADSGAKNFTVRRFFKEKRKKKFSYPKGFGASISALHPIEPLHVTLEMPNNTLEHRLTLSSSLR
jgi:hypothetical protein